MLLGIHFSWKLVLLDILIYATLQSIRIWIDVIVPQNWFNPERPIYRTRPWEKDGLFYQKYFKIRKWKDRLPSVSGCHHFSKRNLENAAPDYLNRFILETCRAESHHLRSVAETVLFLIWNPPLMFAIICLASLVLHVPFIIIQRYNRPRLQKVLTQVLDAESAQAVQIPEDRL